MSKPQKNILTVVKALAKDTIKKKKNGIYTQYGLYYDDITKLMYATNGHLLFKVATNNNLYDACFAVYPRRDTSLQVLKDFLLNNSPHGMTHEVTYKGVKGQQKLLKTKGEKVIDLYGTYINIDYLVDCFKLTGEEKLLVTIAGKLSLVRVFSMTTGLECLIAPIKKKG